MDEEKTSKLKSLFGNLKKKLGKKRYRALLKLICYFFFFLILFIIFELRNDNDYQNNEENNSLIYSDYNVYEFLTVLNINDVNYNIKGKRYKDKYEFIFADETFIIYENELDTFENLDKNIINTFKYDPILINNLIDNSELISEKKIISDNSNVYEYSISIEKYLSILYYDELKNYNLPYYNSNEILLITMTKLDDDVISVELDLSNLYKYYEEVYQKYKIKINYNNVNNVLEF